MRLHNLCADGESHFRDFEIDWVDVRGNNRHSNRLAAGGFICRKSQGDLDGSWHPAPKRQYIVNLDAGLMITAVMANAVKLASVTCSWLKIRRAKGIYTNHSVTRFAIQSLSV